MLENVPDVDMEIVVCPAYGSGNSIEYLQSDYAYDYAYDCAASGETVFFLFFFLWKICYI